METFMLDVLSGVGSTVIFFIIFFILIYVATRK